MDGTSLYCRRMVCTLPLGVLKARHKLIFEPPLPSTKVLAMEGLSMGLLNKVALVFPEPSFWSVAATSGGSIRTQGKQGSNEAEWWVRLPEASLRASAMLTPDLGFCEFFNIEPSTGRPVLVAFTSGLHAWQMERLR